jgi:hypothetical protein
MNDRRARPDVRRVSYRDDDAEPTRGRRLSPGVLFLGLAVIGSIAYMAYAVTVRDASQIPLLASGAVVLALVFAALAGYSLRAIWRAGAEDRGGRALLIALVGGGAAIAAAGCVAGAIILFQVAAGPR